ncbi:MAG: hypothetical protein J5747_06465 [Spirochaetaceae bacterium]|nr:hypothetical protein [Spirochaetaceae bacterium]MBO4705904.1 hypothetical protein [Spirochaetaceae bacterium]
MKKLFVTVFMLILLCPLFGETSIFLGGIYDSFHGNDWGFEGSIDADFMTEASLSAAIDYRYGSNYSMSFTADYKPLFFIVGGGLDFKISKNGVYPGLKADIGFYAGDSFLMLAYGTMGINASNVSAPTMFEAGLKSKYIVPYAAVQLNGFFSQENDPEYTKRKIFADAALSFYSPGFLYSLKAGVQADFEQDSRWESNPKHLSIYGTVGVGKNKDSGTFVIQLTFKVATIMGPKTSGFAVSIGKFPGKTSYIY